MTQFRDFQPHRRSFLTGMSVIGLIGATGVLSACASLPPLTMDDVIERLLRRSSERAFARLTSDGGFWDDQVETVGLGSILGSRGNILTDVLTSAVFKDQLQDAFGDLAAEGAYRAAPLVADAVRVIGVDAAQRLVRGGPTAATTFLRSEMGGTLINAMVPELGQAIRLARDPIIGRAISELAGVDLEGVTSRLSRTIDDAIWREMGLEEAAIRRDPRSTRDPVLIGAFGLNTAR
ncbi:MAG: DUF4197 domain-containing protein [Pontixanthobacter sp.]